MSCTLAAFQSLNLNGVADNGGQVSFTAVSLVDVSATNPAAYCSVRGVIGPGASSIVMKLPMTAWTQRYVQNGCGGECGSDNLGAPTMSTGCVPVTSGALVTATTNMGHTLRNFALETPTPKLTTSPVGPECAAAFEVLVGTL
jgi:hypothetical protein